MICFVNQLIAPNLENKKKLSNKGLNKDLFFLMFQTGVSMFQFKVSYFNFEVSDQSFKVSGQA